MGEMLKRLLLLSVAQITILALALLTIKTQNTGIIGASSSPNTIIKITLILLLYMPHIVVKCYKGRSQEQLAEIAKKLEEAALAAFGTNPGSVSVAIVPVDKEEWKQVYDNEIYGDTDHLLVEPKYKM